MLGIAFFRTKLFEKSDGVFENCFALHIRKNFGLYSELTWTNFELLFKTADVKVSYRSNNGHQWFTKSTKWIRPPRGLVYHLWKIVWMQSNRSSAQHCAVCFLYRGGPNPGKNVREQKLFSSAAAKQQSRGLGGKMAICSGRSQKRTKADVA